MNQFDFKNILALNSQILFNNYVVTFFSKEVKVHKDKVDELMKNFVGAVVDRKFFEKEFVKVDYFESKVEPKNDGDLTNPALILKKWQEYEHLTTHYTAIYNEELKKVRNLAASPVIPGELKKKLLDFENKTMDNLSLIGKTLTSIAKELPEKFPNYKSFEKFKPSGTWNRFNDKAEKVEPLAEEILKYIRNHLKIEEIVN